MTNEIETVLDRRRLRRSLGTWRGLAIAALALAVGAVVFGGDRFAGLVGEKQIARVAIEGTITDDRDQLALLRKIGDAEHVQGVLLFINSPGGTTTGGESLYEALRELAAKKPVVAQFGTVAASAAYIAGLGTDHIVARGNTITGSIGVIAQWPEVSELLNKLGIKFTEVKSGVLKASPTPFKPMDEPSRQVMQQTIDDGFRWFLNLVETRRGLKAADIPGLLEGRIFSGREALSHKLIDEIGGEREAVRWLEEKRGLASNLKVVDWKPEKQQFWGLSGAASEVTGGLITGLGAEGLTRLLARDPNLATLGLDGLVSVWHPSEN
ncbi:MAG: signal peptide peptidase SppA [Hyphomicrobium sp.]